LAPVFSVQPQSRVVAAGAEVIFNPGLSGSPPLGYQWRKDGAALPGRTNPTLPFYNLSTNDTGRYDLLVTNAVGGVTSQVAVLTVLLPPTISQQPQSRSVAAGNDVTFDVIAAGEAPLSYQWRFNGGNLSGATNSSYLVANAQSPASGEYSVVVANSV